VSDLTFVEKRYYGSRLLVVKTILETKYKYL